MNLKAETRDRLGVTWYPMSREFSLPTGAYQARVVARDGTSGRVGSVTHAFEVPPLTGFRVSSPILTDALQNDPTGQSPPKPVLLARRTFIGGSTLYCQFTAYGASLDPATRKPRVSGSWVLKRGDGTLVRESAATPLTPAADGNLARIYGISLAGLPPGDYELGLAVRDEIGVKLAELREPFTVERTVGIR
jgi:hypothetical protein